MLNYSVQSFLASEYANFLGGFCFRKTGLFVVPAFAFIASQRLQRHYYPMPQFYY